MRVRNTNAVIAAPNKVEERGDAATEEYDC